MSLAGPSLSSRPAACSGLMYCGVPTVSPTWVCVSDPAAAGLGRVGEAADGGLQALAADEAHGVVRPAVGVAAEAVDGHDARMLQPAGDLALEQEAGPALGVVGVVALDLLERHLTAQLL